MRRINWSHHRTVAPADLLDVADLKDQSRIDETAEDLLLETYLRAAERTVETELGIAFLEQTWVLKLDYFPSWIIKLPTPPLQSVTSIIYVDPNGATQTLASGEYIVETSGYGGSDRNPGHVRPTFNGSWPSIRHQPLAVTITYVAGFADAESVPDMVKAAILLTAAELYENRERSVAQPFNFQTIPVYESLMGEHRRMWEPEYCEDYGAGYRHGY